uniref:Uncharacterized protein n=1 Tax=Vibrio vulnificus TaxID=672 RepID=A0A6S4QBD9_VIBVL|nr:hypothetical protein [Vibrio vulnificus]
MLTALRKQKRSVVTAKKLRFISMRAFQKQNLKLKQVVSFLGYLLQ